jgi:cytochrome c5
MKTIAAALAVLVSAALAPAARGEEVRYTTHIRPIFEARCSACHGSDSPEYPEFKAHAKKYEAESKGPRMDSHTYLGYFVGWPDSGALMRRLDDGKSRKDGKPGSMYEHLGDAEPERQKNLALFKAWIGHWNLKPWPAVTKQELDRLKLKY